MERVRFILLLAFAVAEVHVAEHFPHALKAGTTQSTAHGRELHGRRLHRASGVGQALPP
jgi:hypothetical protein